MFEGILAKFLNKLLGKYISNLENKQLEVAVWKGDVKMSNLVIRQDAFQQLDIPFQITDGILESLRIEIPWKSLKSEPIKIHIKGLKAVSYVKEDTVFNWMEEEEKSFRQKMRSVEHSESLKGFAIEKQGESKSSEKDSWYGSLVTRLVNNVQITIEDIVIILKDSQKKHFPYELKVSLESLRITTTNNNWLEHFESDIKQSIFKLLLVNSFSISMINNGIERNLLSPIHATGKLSLNKKFTIDIPKTNLDVFVEDLDLALNDFQIGSLLELIASFIILQRRRKFCRYLPEESIVQNPDRWLFYCFISVKDMMKKRKVQFSIESLQKRRSDRLLYMALYSKILTLVEVSKEERALLNELEHRLSEYDILYFRGLARKGSAQQKMLITPLKSKEKPSISSFFFGYFWNTSSKSSPINSLTEKDQEEAAEFFHELVKDDADIFSIEPQNISVSEFSKFKCNLGIQSLIFYLLDSNSSGQNVLLDFSLKNIVSDFCIIGKKKFFSVEIYRILLKSGFTKSTFPYLLEGLDLDKKDNMLSAKFSTDVKQNSFNTFSTTLTFAPLKLILSKEPVDSILLFFQKPAYLFIWNQISTSWSSNAKQELGNLTRFSLEMAFNRGKSSFLQVNMAETHILLPNGLDLSNSFVHEIKFSSLFAQNNNFIAERRSFFRGFTGVSLSQEQLRNLTSIIYDNCTINIREFSCSFHPTHHSYLENIHKSSSKFIDCTPSPVSIVIHKLALPPCNSEFHRLKVILNIQDSYVNFSDLKYQSLMRLFDIFFSDDDDDDLKANIVENSPQSNNDLMDNDAFFDAESQPIVSKFSAEIFSSIPKLDVVDFSFYIHSKRLKFFIDCPLRESDVEFNAALQLDDDFIFELVHTKSRVRINFAIENYKLEICHCEAKGCLPTLQPFLSSKQSFKFNLDYHSILHPLLSTVYNNEKIRIHLEVSQPFLWFDFQSLDCILLFLKQTFPSSSNIYSHKKAYSPVKNDVVFFLKVSVNIQNLIIYLLFPGHTNPTFRLEIPLLSIQYLDGNDYEVSFSLKEKFQLVHHLEHSILMSTEDLNFLFTSTSSKNDIVMKITNCSFVLFPNHLCQLLQFISSRKLNVDKKPVKSKASLANSDTESLNFEKLALRESDISPFAQEFNEKSNEYQPLKRTFSVSINFEVLHVSLPFNDVSSLNFKFSPISLHVNSADLKIESESTVFLINNQSISNQFNWNLHVSKVDSSMFSSHLQSEASSIEFSINSHMELHVDEMKFFILVNRILQITKAIKFGLFEQDKDEICLEDGNQVLKNSIAIQTKTISIACNADNLFLGTIFMSSLNFNLNHLKNGNIMGECYSEDLHVLDTENIKVIFSTTSSTDIYPFVMALQMKPEGISVKVDLQKYELSCPLYFLLKLKQVFLEWTAASTDNLFNFSANEIVKEEPQFFLHVIMEESTFIVSYNEQCLEFKLALCEILKKSNLIVNIPSILTFYYEKEMEKILIINKFSMNVMMETPTPVLQKIHVIFEHINLHYSHLDIATLSDIFKNRFLATPAVISPVCIRDLSLIEQVEEIASFQFKELNIFFVDQSTPLCSAKLEKSFVEIKNWSNMSKFSAKSDVNISAKLFNINTTAWEPLLENTCINFDWKAHEGKKILKIFSDKIMELNFATKYINWYKRMIAYLRRSRKISQLDVISSTCLIRNLSGYEILIWNNHSSSSAIQHSIQNEEEKLVHFQENEESFLLRQDVQLQNFSLHLMGSTWETLQKIFIVKEGSYCYTLRPKINGISHKIVVEISVSSGTKVITFRSPFRFFNSTMSEFDLEIENIDGHLKTVRISPNKYASIKIEESYDCKIRLKPLPSTTNWHERWDSTEFISWKQMSTPNETVLLASKLLIENHDLPDVSSSKRSSSESNLAKSSHETKSSKKLSFSSTIRNHNESKYFYFSLVSQIDSGKNVFLDYPLLTVNINYPLIIHNLIPYPIDCTITDRENSFSFSFDIPNQSNYVLHQVNIAHLLLLDLKLKTSSMTTYSHENYIVISPGNQSKYDVDEKIDMYASPNNCIQIYFDHGNSPTGGRLLYIYSPIIIFNRTELNLYLKHHTFLGYDSSGSEKIILAHNEQEPFLFSYPNENEIRKRVSFSLDNRNWSNSFCFDEVGSRHKFNLIDSSEKSTKNIAMEISIGSGIYLNTTVIEILNQFLFHNKTDLDLDITSALSTDESFSVQNLTPNLAVPFHCTNSRFFIRLHNSKEWSCQISLNVSDESILIPLSFESSNRLLLRIDFSKHESTIQNIVIQKDNLWPFKIINQTSQSIIFNQKNSERLHQVPQQGIFDYALDNPFEPHVVYFSFLNCLKEVLVNKYGAIEPFSARLAGELLWFGINVTTSGSTFVIRIYQIQRNPTFPTHLYSSPSQQTISSNRSDTSTSPSIETASLVVIISCSEIGIALYNEDLEEFLYARFSDVNLSAKIDESFSEYLFSVRWVQIDNQLFQSKYPVCFCPKSLLKSESYANPFISVSIKKQHRAEYDNLSFFDNISLRMSDISFNIDENTFYEIVMFYRAFSTGDLQNLENQEESNFLIRANRFDSNLFKVIPSSSFNYYIGQMTINQCGVYFSFPTASDVDENKFLKSIGYYSPIFKILASTQSAKYVLPSFSTTNFLTNPQILSTKLQQHYLSIDRFPFAMKLDIFAVLDIFKKTYSGFKGFTQHVASEQDIKTGLMRGTGTLVKKSISGISSAAFKYANLLNGIISSSSSGMFSQKFQDKRNFIRSSAAGKGSAASTFTTGARSLFKSITSGVTGVIDEPIEGINEGGTSGLIRGIFTGTAGLVFKPCIGAIDMVTYSLKAINEFVEDEKTHTKTRLPKVKPYDGVLHEYSIKEAYGQFLLRIVSEGKYINTTYVAHIDVISEGSVCILHQEGIVYVHLTSLRIVWEVELVSMLYSNPTKDSILIGVQTKDKVINRVIVCPEDATRMWFHEMIAEALATRNQRKKVTEVK